MMNDKSSTQRELISALADGQLRGKEFVRAVDLAATDADARATWHAYHLVGDLMRNAQSADCVLGDDSPAFLARFQSRLAQEVQAARPAGVVSAPSFATSDLIANYPEETGTSALISSRSTSANDASFRWKLLAGVASLAAVAAVSWGVITGANGPETAPQLAQTAAPQTPAEPPQVMIRDPHLDALLAAHKQFGGTSALQMPAGFMRNATFEGPAR